MIINHKSKRTILGIYTVHILIHKQTWLLDSVEILLEPAVLKKSLIIFCLTDMADWQYVKTDNNR